MRGAPLTLFLGAPLRLIVVSAGIGGAGMHQNTIESPLRNLEPISQELAAGPTRPVKPDNLFGPGPLHRLFVDAGAVGELDPLFASGVIVCTIDSTSFLMAIVDEGPFRGADELARAGSPSGMIRT